MTKMRKRLEERGSIARTPGPQCGRGSPAGLPPRGLVFKERVGRRLTTADRSLRALLEAHEGATGDSA